MTGITAGMVAGKTIDLSAVRALVGTADLVIAHDARLDRAFCERPDDAFRVKPSACSVADVPWRDLGFDGAKLGYRVNGCGMFHGGHRAVTDYNALLEVLLRAAIHFQRGSHMRGRRHGSKALTSTICVALALWPALPARAGGLPVPVHEVAVTGSEARPPVPSTPFHLTLQGRNDGDDADMLLDVMVFPATRHVTGMLRSKGPDEVLTHVSGKFEPDGPSVKAHLIGFPSPISGCFGHGPAVSKIAEADIMVDAGWRTGRVTLAYKGGSPSDSGGDWKTTAAMPVSGGEPLPWRDVDDIRWGGDAPFAWKDHPCFSSNDRQRARLARLGSDASRHLLALSDRPVRNFVPWTIRNGSAHHILAMVTCAGQGDAGGPQVSNVVLLHPRETLPLKGFRTLDDVTCTVTRSHLDD